MTTRKPNKPLHPLALYARRHEWKPGATARFFGLRPIRYSQIVGGHSNTTYRRAASWERKSLGEVKAADVMEWQLVYGLIRRKKKAAA